MGPSGAYKQAMSTESSVAQQQLGLAQAQAAESEQDRQQRIALQQPLIAKETDIARGGSAALAASMPVISQVSGGYEAAKAQIMNNIPAGAGRDRALADLETQKETTIGGTQAQMVQQAPDILANIGSGVGAFSLQELGAALGGYSGAAGTSGAIAQQENQRQAQMISILSSLASTAGGAVGGINWSSLGNAGTASGGGGNTAVYGGGLSGT